MYKIQDTRYIDKIKEFTNLYAWQKGHRLVVFIYSISKKFPEDEKFGITSQLRRASVSITSNIAEGFGRKNGKEKIYFYRIAHRYRQKVCRKNNTRIKRKTLPSSRHKRK